jgi:hypothetical protein
MTLCGALTAAGCTTDKPVSSCLAWKPIYLSDPDIAVLSRGAKEKIAAHNRTYESLCK